MAQKVNIELIDDLDGAKAAETVTFGLDGTHYEIDLSNKNATKLRKVMAEYVNGGRKVRANGTKRSGEKKTPPARQENLAEVRAWATANGYEVNDRGRVPAAVVEAYRAAK